MDVSKITTKYFPSYASRCSLCRRCRCRCLTYSTFYRFRLLLSLQMFNAEFLVVMTHMNSLVNRWCGIQQAITNKAKEETVETFLFISNELRNLFHANSMIFAASIQNHFSRWLLHDYNVTQTLFSFRL